MAVSNRITLFGRIAFAVLAAIIATLVVGSLAFFISAMVSYLLIAPGLNITNTDPTAPPLPKPAFLEQIGHAIQTENPEMVILVLQYLFAGGMVLLPFTFIFPTLQKIWKQRKAIRDVGEPAATGNPEIQTLTQHLADEAGISEPDVFVVPWDNPVAYAVGGGWNGKIYLSETLIDALSQTELEAVIAHEIGHLDTGGTRTLELLIMLAGAFEWTFAKRLPGTVPDESVDEQDSSTTLSAGSLSSGEGAAMAPFFRAPTELSADLLWLGVALVSRARDKPADEMAAELTGSPHALASALETLEEVRAQEIKRVEEKPVRILNVLPRPYNAKHGWFRTHPETAARIQRLETMR